MPLTSSTMVPLGTTMPAFALPDVVSGRIVDSASFDPATPVLVLFICAHCPFTRNVAPAIARVVRDYRDRVTVVAISANDPSQVPQDSPQGLKQLASAFDFQDPFCFDESGAVARAFGAECTPESFLYDSARRLVYRGEIADSRAPAGTSTAVPLWNALDALLNGRAVSPEQRPGLGCNIKWRIPASHASAIA